MSLQDIAQLQHTSKKGSEINMVMNTTTETSHPKFEEPNAPSQEEPKESLEMETALDVTAQITNSPSEQDAASSPAELTIESSSNVIVDVITENPGHSSPQDNASPGKVFSEGSKTKAATIAAAGSSSSLSEREIASSPNETDETPKTSAVGVSVDYRWPIFQHDIMNFPNTSSDEPWIGAVHEVAAGKSNKIPERPDNDAKDNSGGDGTAIQSANQTLEIESNQGNNSSRLLEPDEIQRTEVVFALQSTAQKDLGLDHPGTRHIQDAEGVKVNEQKEESQGRWRPHGGRYRGKMGGGGNWRRRDNNVSLARQQYPKSGTQNNNKASSFHAATTSAPPSYTATTAGSRFPATTPAETPFHSITPASQPDAGKPTAGTLASDDTLAMSFMNGETIVLDALSSAKAPSLNAWKILANTSHFFEGIDFFVIPSSSSEADKNVAENSSVAAAVLKAKPSIEVNRSVGPSTVLSLAQPTESSFALEAKTSSVQETTTNEKVKPAWKLQKSGRKKSRVPVGQQDGANYAKPSHPSQPYTNSISTPNIDKHPLPDNKSQAAAATNATLSPPNHQPYTMNVGLRGSGRGRRSGRARGAGITRVNADGQASNDGGNFEHDFETAPASRRLRGFQPQDRDQTFQASLPALSVSGPHEKGELDAPAATTISTTKAQQDSKSHEKIQLNTHAAATTSTTSAAKIQQDVCGPTNTTPLVSNVASNIELGEGKITIPVNPISKQKHPRENVAIPRRQDPPKFRSVAIGTWMNKTPRNDELRTPALCNNEEEELTKRLMAHHDWTTPIHQRRINWDNLPRTELQSYSRSQEANVIPRSVPLARADANCKMIHPPLRTPVTQKMEASNQVPDHVEVLNVSVMDLEEQQRGLAPHLRMTESELAKAKASLQQNNAQGAEVSQPGAPKAKVQQSPQDTKGKGRAAVFSHSDQVSLAVQGVPVNQQKQTLPHVTNSRHPFKGVKILKTKPASEPDSNAWGTVKNVSVDTGPAVNPGLNGAPLKKDKLEYEHELAQPWDGGWRPAPVEWDVRPSFDNNDRRHIAFMENWMNDRTQEALDRPVLVDKSKPSFLTGEELAGGYAVLSSPINQEDHETIRPDDPMTHEKAEQTAAKSAKAFNKERRMTKKELKEEKRWVREAIRRRDENYVPPPNPHVPLANIFIRPAQRSDMRQIADIYNYYVANSVLAAEQLPMDEAQWRGRWESAAAEKYAFLVAVLKNQGNRRIVAEVIVGFAYAEDHGAMDNAYRYTCELQFWVANSYLRQGIGKTLVDRMLTSLDPFYTSRNGTDFCAHDQNRYEMGGPRFIYNVIVNILYPAKDDTDFQWKKAWLAQWDFEQTGTVPLIAYKLRQEQVSSVRSVENLANGE